MGENFDYKSYSLEHLEEWVNDSLNVDEVSAKEIYDRITQTIKDNIKYHQCELKKAQELLRMMTLVRKIWKENIINERLNTITRETF